MVFQMVDQWWISFGSRLIHQWDTNPISQTLDGVIIYKVHHWDCMLSLCLIVNDIKNGGKPQSAHYYLSISKTNHMGLTAVVDLVKVHIFINILNLTVLDIFGVTNRPTDRPTDQQLDLHKIFINVFGYTHRSNDHRLKTFFLNFQKISF